MVWKRSTGGTLIHLLRVAPPEAARHRRHLASTSRPRIPDLACGSIPAAVDGDSADEAEWRTRKRRIDPKLDHAGWRLAPSGAMFLRGFYRTEEEATANGPADYALWLDRHIAAIVEAKKVRVGAQEVL